MDRLRFSTPRRTRQRPPWVVAMFGQRATINGVAVLFGLLLLVYLAFDWWPLLVALVVVAGAGVDQALRGHPGAQFRGAAATAIYLFVPVLYALGAGLFLREVSHGLWNLPAAALAAVIFAFAAHAEYLSVDARPETYPLARFALIIASLLTAFALFTVVSISGLPLGAATPVVAIVALLLTVDMLRELEVQTATLFAYAAGVAAVVAEVRWAIYYLPLGDLLAGALLLITFYVSTGLIESYLSGRFDRDAIREYGLVGVAGLIVVGGAQWLTTRA